MLAKAWIQRLGERFWRFLPLMIPFLLLPLFLEWEWSRLAPEVFNRLREAFITADIAYIFAVRLLILDVMLFFVGQARQGLHTALLHIVGLYLEITAITIAYFAVLFDLFGTLRLFHFSVAIDPGKLATIQSHTFLTALYISAETFTTLGLGDWVPQSLNAMFALRWRRSWG